MIIDTICRNPDSSGKNPGNGAGKRRRMAGRNESGTIDVRSGVIILAALLLSIKLLFESQLLNL